MTRRIVLASTSRYRAELLARLGLAFERFAPNVDETPRRGEAPAELALRLAEAKARAVPRDFAEALVIGSDQVAERDGIAIGKPGTRDAALAQLAAASGSKVVFHTALCVFDTGSRAATIHCDATRVTFRTLTRTEIARYLDRESVLDCAGSFKAEGLGIGLFESIRSDDPTALIGLPLIALARMLREAGVSIP